jgi:hypothetical protein
MLLEEMSDRVENTEDECPSDLGPRKMEIDDGSIDMRGKYEETMEYIGKASPISFPGITSPIFDHLLKKRSPQKARPVYRNFFRYGLFLLAT